MSPVQIAFTDLLHTKRLQTLQSVDDAIDKVRHKLPLAYGPDDAIASPYPVDCSNVSSSNSHILTSFTGIIQLVVLAVVAPLRSV